MTLLLFPVPACVSLSLIPLFLKKIWFVWSRLTWSWVHMTRTSGSRTVRATTVWFVKNRPAVLSHLSSALMRHHVADMSPINSLCVILIKKLIAQNESRNKTSWELPAALFWRDSIKGDITKLCSTSEKILNCPHKSQQWAV